MNNTAFEYYKRIAKKSILCPVCSHDKYTVLFSNDRYKMGLQTVICNQCGLIYLNPRPTEEAMISFYENDYRMFYESIAVPTKKYIEKGPFIPRAKFVLEVLQNYLDKANTFIDIGCAEGTLLNIVEENYPKIKTFGIEPSIGFGGYAKENIKGKVFIGNYKTFIKNYPGHRFDVLATTHVLEHILNPVEFLYGLKGLMTNRSVLYIEVPNIMSSKVSGLGAIHLGHVLSFDPSTLKILLKRTGFEIIEFFTEGLPAKTPAMCVICKLTKEKRNSIYPTKSYIKSKSQKLRKRVLNQQKVSFWKKWIKRWTK
jgi:2-polyprenyl-3-methyl-5-hydroxy-6-metoxy-1,4-benzoquinol methylase